MQVKVFSDFYVLLVIVSIILQKHSLVQTEKKHGKITRVEYAYKKILCMHLVHGDFPAFIAFWKGVFGE